MFEGGVRVSAFLAGGFLPATMRGIKKDGYIHGADWYCIESSNALLIAQLIALLIALTNHALPFQIFS